MRVQGKPVNTADEDCPLHRKPVSKVCHRCPLWVQFRGTDPNTGAEVDEWGCSLAWIPALLVENSQQQRATGAAVESFRNEMVKSNEQGQRLMAGALIASQGHNPKLIE